MVVPGDDVITEDPKPNINEPSALMQLYFENLRDLSLELKQIS